MGYQAEVEDAVHRAVVAEVRQLLERDWVTQRDLAVLLELNVSGVNRRLLLENPDDPEPDDEGRRRRRTKWAAWEVYAIADTYGVSLGRFFPPSPFSRI